MSKERKRKKLEWRERKRVRNDGSGLSKEGKGKEIVEKREGEEDVCETGWFRFK